MPAALPSPFSKTAKSARPAAAARGGVVLCLLLLPACRTLEPEIPTVAGAIDQATFARIDRSGEGKVSPAEMAAYKHEEGLAEIDFDNDRRISLAEWKAARPSDPPDDALFHRIDKDGDGYISEDEAVAHLLAQPAFAEAFRAMDADGDGHLVWEEYAAGDASTLDVKLLPRGR